MADYLPDDDPNLSPGAYFQGLERYTGPGEHSPLRVTVRPIRPDAVPKPTPDSLLPPPQIPSAPAIAGRVGMAAARSTAPDLTSLLSGEPAPPIENLPEQGKVPSTDDPRVPQAIGEMGELASGAIGPGAGPKAALAAAKVAGIKGLPLVLPSFFRKGLPLEERMAQWMELQKQFHQSSPLREASAATGRPMPAGQMQQQLPVPGQPAAQGVMSDAQYADQHRRLQELKVTVARLGPMREKLVELGATPEQMSQMDAAQAYKFIKERSPAGMGKVSPGWQDRNQEFLDRIRGMQDELTDTWQAGKAQLQQQAQQAQPSPRAEALQRAMRTVSNMRREMGVTALTPSGQHTDAVLKAISDALGPEAGPYVGPPLTTDQVLQSIRDALKPIKPTGQLQQAGPLGDDVLRKFAETHTKQLGENTQAAGEINAANPEAYAGSAAPAAGAGEPGGPVAVQRGGAGGVAGLEAAQRKAAEAAGPRQPLEGLPSKALLIKGDYFAPGPSHQIHTVAEQYMRDADLPYAPPRTYQPVDKERAARIAQAFDDMPHAPDDPAVKASYNQMIKETVAQFKAIEKTGLKIEFIKEGQPDPYYASPRLANMDMRDNNHLWVFPTESGFGSGPEGVKNNPLLRPTTIVIDGKRLVANDVFRIVHDYFGHFKEGVGFRADGEENAWRSHSAMYSDLARPAMTSETRGQNSWLNYGPHGATNRTAKSENTVYADQKIGLLPPWAISEGANDPGVVPEKFRKAKPATNYLNTPVRSEFPGIYKDPRLLASEAEARVAPEDPALRELFGVGRGELHEIAQGRKGNMESTIAFAKKPQGSEAARAVTTPKNAQRLGDALHEATKRAPFLVRGMDPWYVMDPAYWRLEEMFGPEEAARRYKRFNTMVGMASPATAVENELSRGTAAHHYAEEGRFPEFRRLGGTGAIEGVPGHAYHSTAHTGPMQKYLDTGEMKLEKPKVRSYVEASGVPQTGFVTNVPVGDAHFSRAIGLADTRGSQDFGKSISTPELQTILPWFRKVSAGAGIEPVSAQARTWGLFAPQTGVDTTIGAPKLELLAKGIKETAHRLGISPQEMRDRVLSGKGYIHSTNYSAPLEQFTEKPTTQQLLHKAKEANQDWFE